MFINIRYGSKGVGVTGLWVSGLTGFRVMKKKEKSKHRKEKQNEKEKKREKKTE